MQERYRNCNKYFRKQAYTTEKYSISFISQICENKLLSKLPFYHLLPRPLYKWVLRKLRGSSTHIEESLKVRDARSSSANFYRFLKKEGCLNDKLFLYLFNRSYKIEYGLEPGMQDLYFAPLLRNLNITTSYFVVSPK